MACWGDLTNARQNRLTSISRRVAAADRATPYMPSCAPCTMDQLSCRYKRVALCCLRRRIHEQRNTPATAFLQQAQLTVREGRLTGRTPSAESGPRGLSGPSNRQGANEQVLTLEHRCSRPTVARSPHRWSARTKIAGV